MKKILKYILVLVSLSLIFFQAGCYDSAGHILDINGNPVSGNLSAYPVSINGTIGSGNTTITIVSINGTLPITEADVVDLVADLAGKEPTIVAGTVAEYWRGDKTWQNLNSAITALGFGTSNITLPITEADVTNLVGDLSGKQATLVSGTNIKTINGASVLGAGDLVVTASAAWGSITGILSAQTDLQGVLDGLVPYSGATDNVDLSTYDLTAENVNVYNTITLQGAEGDGLAVISNPSSSNHTFDLPSASGTFALTSDLAGYLTSISSQNVTDALGYIPADNGTLGNANGIAQLDGSALVPTDQLGTGTANATTYLRGDQSWATPTASAAWGSITGTLSSQTDLQSALNAKLGYDFVGSSNITTLGTIVTGTWNGTAIDDSYISSAVAWNAKIDTELDPVFTASEAYKIDSSNTTEWNTAYGWGNHASAGYLTSANLSGYLTYAFTGSSNITTVGTIIAGTWNGTAIEDTYISSASTWNAKLSNVNSGVATDINGILSGNGTAVIIAPNNTALIGTQESFTTALKSNYDTAYGWGNHATQGYLTSSYIGSSNVTTLGTIASGTWQGNVLNPTYGGTGVNNGNKTITLGGFLTLSGNYNTTITVTDNTTVTLPTTGTLIATRIVYIICIDPATALTTGTGKAYFTVPIELNGMNLVAVAASVYTASSSGLPTFGIWNNTDSTNMLSTNITIDVSPELTSYTALTQAVIDTAKDDVATGDQIRLDCNVSGTGSKGMDIKLTFGTP